MTNTFEPSTSVTDSICRAIKSQFDIDAVESKSLSIIRCNQGCSCNVFEIQVDPGKTSFIAKFPRDDDAKHGLNLEMSLLKYLNELSNLAPLPFQIPQLKLHYHTSEIPFSLHKKVPGSHLTTEEYENLNELAKNNLALKIAKFYQQLHLIPISKVEAIFVDLEVRELLSPYNDILIESTIKKNRKLLNEKYQFTDENINLIYFALKEYRRVISELDTANRILGHFDVHGENLGFDHNREELIGIFDFADCGIGDFHLEMHTSSWISIDLSRRIINFYQQLTNKQVNRTKVHLFTLMCRLDDYATLMDRIENGRESCTEAEIKIVFERIPQWIEILKKYDIDLKES
ncbi:unnamed protein product [Didymodactylos carnosus]|uniref:Aminoglycoside phosphotransferase domain-containing protein n=1 Tax=Didymodactylos carnosus TaxID=1234261 RepID=A0A815GZ94_9BILA|nr:unnamed protein product [Didymodactylos carnosus]CAF1344968.1 unnamed protein product [Didymodactylos carnosus]CAF3584477.1 unnamed protein product [Didymodactylos carnosus]CAF4209716.1 unnamed protein product [Didymodactylos carnosus]